MYIVKAKHPGNNRRPSLNPTTGAPKCGQLCKFTKNINQRVYLPKKSEIYMDGPFINVATTTEAAIGDGELMRGVSIVLKFMQRKRNLSDYI